MVDKWLHERMVGLEPYYKKIMWPESQSCISCRRGIFDIRDESGHTYFCDFPHEIVNGRCDKFRKKQMEK